MRKNRETPRGGARQAGAVGALGIVASGALCAAVLSVATRVPPSPLHQEPIPRVEIGGETRRDATPRRQGDGGAESARRGARRYAGERGSRRDGGRRGRALAVAYAGDGGVPAGEGRTPGGAPDGSDRGTGPAGGAPDGSPRRAGNGRGAPDRGAQGGGDDGSPPGAGVPRGGGDGDARRRPGRPAPAPRLAPAPVGPAPVVSSPPPTATAAGTDDDYGEYDPVEDEDEAVPAPAAAPATPTPDQTDDSGDE